MTDREIKKAIVAKARELRLVRSEATWAMVFGAAAGLTFLLHGRPDRERYLRLGRELKDKVKSLA